ncbi:MAG: alkaline phosphatase family protein [Oligoflexia bacterium]|nr:alkaline phosphatase family protein [Oligoflexia bacterium]
MRLKVRWVGVVPLFMAVAGFLWCCGTAPRIPAVYTAAMRFQPETSRVLIVSFDGLRPDAIDRASALHLQSMREVGAFGTGDAVMPSITLVNHASMVSGVGPAKHGITWNTYLPEKGTLMVPTMFDLAKKKGLTTAMVAGKEKFLHLARPGTLDRFVLQEGSPLAVAKDALEILQRDRPQLMLVHFRHPDSEGHSGGWLGSSQLDAINEADQGLGTILKGLNEAGLLESTTVIATADHGGNGTTHGSDSEADRTIPWLAVGAEVPLQGAIPARITQYDTAATAADLLELELPADWDGKSVFGR